MIAVILLLLFLGLLFIFLETFLPGAIAGITGCALVGASAYLCFSRYGSSIGMAYLIGSLILAGGVGIAAFLFIIKRAALNPPDSANPVSPLARAQIGKTGRALKALNPTGSVEIDGRRFMARSAFTQEEIPAQSNVVVTDIDGSYLIVRPENKTQEP